MKLIDKIKLLKLQVEELNKNLIEIQKEYEIRIKGVENLNYVRNMQDKHNLSMNLKKEEWFSYLELLRAKINIVRKISPDSANYLDRRLQEYEPIIKNYLSHLDDLVSNPSKKKAVILSYDVDKMNRLNDVHVMIQICKNCIKDTIKQFEECEFS